MSVNLKQYMGRMKRQSDNYIHPSHYVELHIFMPWSVEPLQVMRLATEITEWATQATPIVYEEFLSAILEIWCQWWA